MLLNAAPLETPVVPPVYCSMASWSSVIDGRENGGSALPTSIALVNEMVLSSSGAVLGSRSSVAEVVITVSILVSSLILVNLGSKYTPKVATSWFKMYYFHIL